MRDVFPDDNADGRPTALMPAGDTEAALIRDGLEGQVVCPFCGIVGDGTHTVCPKCTMENTAVARKATKLRIGPWYVLQNRNPAAPGMKWETLLSFVRKGRVKPQSIVRGSSTHQLWRFAAHVKGLSREFGVCYSCGGSVEREANLCPHCNRLQDPPTNPDTLLEGVESESRLPVFKEITSPQPVAETLEALTLTAAAAVSDEELQQQRKLREEAEAFVREQRQAIEGERSAMTQAREAAERERQAMEAERAAAERERELVQREQEAIAHERDAILLEKELIERDRDGLAREREAVHHEREAAATASRDAASARETAVRESAAMREAVQRESAAAQEAAALREAAAAREAAIARESAIAREVAAVRDAAAKEAARQATAARQAAARAEAAEAAAAPTAPAAPPSSPDGDTSVWDIADRENLRNQARSGQGSRMPSHTSSASSPIPGPSQKSGKPKDAFLSPKELAAAFKLNLTPGGEYDIAARHSEAAATSQTPAPGTPEIFSLGDLPEPPRRGGHKLLIVFILVLVAAGAAIALNSDLRRKMLNLAGISDGSSPSVAPKTGAHPAKDELPDLPPVDNSPLPAFVPAPRPNHPAPAVPQTQSIAPPSGNIPAATEPAESSPQASAEAAAKAKILYNRAREAESKLDYATAVTMWEELQKLPKAAWPGDVDFFLAMDRKLQSQK